jgi:hypothetical protein
LAGHGGRLDEAKLAAECPGPRQFFVQSLILCYIALVGRMKAIRI